MDSPWITQCLSLEHLFSLGALGLLAGLLPPGGGLLFQIPNTKKKSCFWNVFLLWCSIRLPSWDVNFPFAWRVNASRIHEMIGRIQQLPTVTQQQAELTGGAGAGAAGVALSERVNFSCNLLCKIFHHEGRRPLQYVVAALLHPESGGQGEHHDGEACEKKQTL